MNVLELKTAYLKYMGEHPPVWINRRPTKLVDFPSPDHFALNGYSQWFARRLTRDPWSSEAFSHCARCMSEMATPGQPPFFMSLEDVGWNMFDRRKAIKDNLGFIEEIGLDPARLKVSVWKGGKLSGAGLGPASEGAGFKKFAAEGFELPRDEQSIKAWKECGLNETQIVEIGESEKIDPSGSGTVHLDTNEYFAGIRSGIHYPVNGRYVEIGESVVDQFLKKSAAAKLSVAGAALEDDVDSDRLLLRLKAKTVVGGFVAERLAMALNGSETAFDLAPYRDLEAMLVKLGRGADADRARVHTAVARIPAVIWLVHDGANLPKGNTKTRQAIFRGTLKTVVENMAALNLDSDETYTGLFKQACSFYAQDDDFKSIASLELACLDEIKKQKRRMKAAK